MQRNEESEMSSTGADKPFSEFKLFAVVKVRLNQLSYIHFWMLLSSQPLLSVKVKRPSFSQNKDAKGAKIVVPNKVYWFTWFRKNSCEIMQPQFLPLDV